MILYRHMKDFEPFTGNRPLSKDGPSATTGTGGYTAARLIWLGVAILFLVLLFVQIPYSHAYLIANCIDQFCEYGVSPPPGEQALLQAGITPALYAGYYTLWSVAEPLAYLLMGLLIIWKKTNERMAILGAFMLLAMGVTFSPLAIFGQINPAWELASGLISLPGPDVLFLLVSRWAF